VRYAVILVLGAAVIVISGCRGTAGEKERGFVDLARYRWKNRLLFVFAPSAEDGRLVRQRAALDEQRKGVVDRHLVRFDVMADNAVRNGGEDLGEGAAAFLRRTFAVEPESYTVILVGKDGGEKMRRTAVVPVAEIFGIIDAMPMRQAEMRDQRGT
jgi:hypothetical protein